MGDDTDKDLQPYRVRLLNDYGAPGCLTDMLLTDEDATNLYGSDAVLVGP